MGVAQFIDDYGRILSNGLSFGLADRISAPLDGMTLAQEQAATEAARQRQGLAGDLANGATMFVGAGGALKAVKAAPAVARTIAAGVPVVDSALSGAALNATRSVGLMNGITRAEALARLGLDAGPGLAERALGTAGSVVKAPIAYAMQHPWKSAGGLAAVLGSALIDNANRANNAQAQATTTSAPAKAVAQPTTGKTSAPAAQAPTQVLDQNGNPLNPTFSQLAAAYQAANGGQISLRALSALAGVAAQTSPAPRFAPITPQSIAAGRALVDSNTLADLDYKRAQSENDAAAYRQALADNYARENSISHTGMYDPLTGLATGYPGDGVH